MTKKNNQILLLKQYDVLNFVVGSENVVPLSALSIIVVEPVNIALKYVGSTNIQ